MALIAASAPAGSLPALLMALVPLVTSDSAAEQPGSLLLPVRPPLLLESSEEEELLLLESSEELLSLLDEPPVDAAVEWDVLPPSGFEVLPPAAGVVPDEAQPPSRTMDDARAVPTRIRTPRVVDIGGTPIVVGRAKCFATLPQRVDGECTDERVNPKYRPQT